MPIAAFVTKTLSDLTAQRAAIVEAVHEQGYALVRGLFDREEIRKTLKPLYAYANIPSNHLPSQGVPPSKIRENSSKWSIGGYSPSQKGVSRFMLINYNPLFQEDIFGLHETFKQLIHVRDILANRPALTDDKIMPTHFNACRVQIYPAGGGFMSGHIDSTAVSSLEEVTQKGDQYIQLVLLLTEKGTDYQAGGAFVRTPSKGLVDSEENSLSGDVVVYDGSTYHGVNDIDAFLPLHLQDLKGRAVALVTIYQAMGD